MRINKIKIFNYLFIFYLIYITDTLLFGTNFNQSIVLNAKVSLVVFCVVYIIYSLLKYRFQFYKKEILIIFLPVSFIISNMLINNDFSMGILLKGLLIVTGYYIAKNFETNIFFEIFTKIMIFLTSYSLVFYLLFIKETAVTNNLLNRMPELKRNVMYNNRFANLIFTNIPIDNIEARSRNWGVFWEPGAYAVYLNIALLIILFSNIKINRKKGICILAMGILTTFSTTGIISMILIFLSFLIQSNINAKIEKNLIKKILFFVPIMAFVNSDALFKVFGKLNEGLTNISFSSRWYSIVYNFRIFISNFFFGIGTSKYDQSYRIVIMNELGLSLGNTNTILLILAQYGLYIGILYIYLIWRFARKLGKEDILTISIFLSIIILLFMEDFTYSLFMNTIFFFGLNSYNKSTELKDMSMIKVTVK